MIKYVKIFLLIIFLLTTLGCSLFEDDEITYDYPTITKIEIAKIPDGEWDEFSNPDIYCTLIDTLDNTYYTSDVVDNVNEFPITFKPDDLELKDNERELFIKVYDDDVTDSDLIGTVGPFSAQLIMDDSSNVYTMENYTWTLEVSVTLKW